MRFLRLYIKNFRNFKEVECRLGPHVVLLGENGAGKSNLLHALRLILDPELPDASRFLNEEDFWDGGAAFGGTEIIVSVDLTEYDKQAAVLACLADHQITPPSGWALPVARLTYRYAPRSTIEPAKLALTTKEHYDFAIFGRDDLANPVRHEVRRYLGFRVLHALRDAESDLRAWRRSPLRPLLEDVRDKLDPAALRKVAAEIDAATDAITSEAPLDDLQSAIRNRVSEMIGDQHTLLPTFGFNTTDPRQLVHVLRLFMDDQRRRQVADTSLGLANVLYLVLLLLNAEQQVKKFATVATVIGIEEPEAHLHPQLQRLVFRDLLSKKLPVLVSTHSPNIASVAPVETLTVLRNIGNESQIASIASSASFTRSELQDLARYLDVTRAEILFGRGIVLVEGDAERFLVPAMAGLLPTPVRLDEFGISVCSVAGTDFVPYAKLLGALGIPYVIITDGDERHPTEGKKVEPGVVRGAQILHATGHPSAAAVIEQVKTGSLLTRLTLQDAGIFFGHRTLESVLLAVGAGLRLKAAFKELMPRSRDDTLRPFEATGLPTNDIEDSLIKLVERIGKGRFAQALIGHLIAADVPPYVKLALEAIIQKCRHD